jgi:hypothetical protein
MKTTIYNFFVVFIFILAIAWFLYGVIYFLDAPIKPCGEEIYCGKQGQIRTEDEYKSFKFWETGLIIVYSIMFFLAIMSRRKEVIATVRRFLG